MKGGVKTRHLCEIRIQRSDDVDQREASRLMQRVQRDETCEFLEYGRIDQNWPRESVASVNHAMSDDAKRRSTVKLLETFQRFFHRIAVPPACGKWLIYESDAAFTNDR